MTGSSYRAPWGGLVIGITVLLSLFLIGLPLYIHLFQTEQRSLSSVLIIILPLIVIVASLFSIRCYQIEAGRLIVDRFVLSRTFELSGLQAVEADPHAMASSIRTFGNGGFFSFSGWFRNKKLGAYRAFATDFKRAVVLRFPDMILVVTPDDPTRFVEQIRSFAGLS